MDTRSIIIRVIVAAVLLAATGVDLLLLMRRRQRVISAISLILAMVVLAFYVIAAILNATIRSEFETWTNQNETITLALIPLAYVVSIVLAAIGLLLALGSA